MSKTIEVLEEKIYQLEIERNKYRDELEQLKNFANFSWCISYIMSEKINAGLPVPRLELRYTNIDGYHCECIHSIVYRHTDGFILVNPLSRTVITIPGGMPYIKRGKIDTPWRDGVHIRDNSKQLGLPAFVIFGDITDEIGD